MKEHSSVSSGENTKYIIRHGEITQRNNMLVEINHILKRQIKKIQCYELNTE